VRYAAADSVVGLFGALDYEGIAGVQMLGDPIKVYMGVAVDNAQLTSALTDALRQVRDNGVLGIILSKWVGSGGAKLVQSSDAVISQSGADLLATQTTATST
jgi:ABC-type amino acid transport substrate-binding protein